MTSHTQALAQFFEAINRHDMQAMAEYFDAEVVRVEPDGFPTAGTYRGCQAVQAHVARGRGSWAEGSCQPESYFVQGDRVVVYLYAWVRVHGSSEWSGGRFADGFEFRDGKITQYLSFAERGDALKWAGMDGDAAAAGGSTARSA